MYNKSYSSAFCILKIITSPAAKNDQVQVMTPLPVVTRVQVGGLCGRYGSWNSDPSGALSLASVVCINIIIINSLDCEAFCLQNMDS